MEVRSRAATMPRTWDEALGKLGLVRSGRRHAGRIRGIALDAWDDAVHTAQVRALLLPPLDLGLSLRSPTPWEAPAIRSENADELDRLFALLAGELSTALEHKVTTGDWTYELTDEALTMATPAGVRADEVAARVELAVWVAEVIGRQRLAVPAASTLGPRVPFVEKVARDRGLRATRTPLGLEGKVGDLSVRLTATRTGRAVHGLWAEVRFAAPLGLGLEVEPGDPSGWQRLLGAQDIAVGDATFDDAFTVRATEPAVAAATLDAGVRHAIANLSASEIAVRLSDEGLRARGPRFPETEAELLGRLDALLRLADAIVVATALARSSGHSPYR